MDQSREIKSIPTTIIRGGHSEEVRKDVYYYTNQIANIVMVGFPQREEWVLIDAGMPKSGAEVIAIARQRFGRVKPKAIILTHGHFDHVGSLPALIQEWNVPVYAHPLEIPYLTGQKTYPEPDAATQGGSQSKLASIYPHEPVNISGVIQPLPEDGTVPELPAWRWIHTPGHSPGHISLFREKDRFLIAGDTFVTVRADSFYRVLLQEKEVNGPPRYLTTDWQAAWESVRKLEELQPEYAVTGHGQSMIGDELREGLAELAGEFDTLAIPAHGKFASAKKK